MSDKIDIKQLFRDARDFLADMVDDPGPEAEAWRRRIYDGLSDAALLAAEAAEQRGDDYKAIILRGHAQDFLNGAVGLEDDGQVYDLRGNLISTSTTTEKS
jgi:hypothetical protein